MATISEIAAEFSTYLADGPDRLTKQAGAGGSLAVPFSSSAEAELGLNPRGGFYLRVRQSMDHFGSEQRLTRMAELVALTASARFASGWIGGSEAGNVLSLTAPLPSGSDAAAIEAMLKAGDTILRDGLSTSARPAGTAAAEPAAGADWLRI